MQRRYFFKKISLATVGIPLLVNEAMASPFSSNNSIVEKTFTTLIKNDKTWNTIGNTKVYENILEKIKNKGYSFEISNTKTIGDYCYMLAISKRSLFLEKEYVLVTKDAYAILNESQLNTYADFIENFKYQHAINNSGIDCSKIYAPKQILRAKNRGEVRFKNSLGKTITIKSDKKIKQVLVE